MNDDTADDLASAIGGFIDRLKAENATLQADLAASRESRAKWEHKHDARVRDWQACQRELAATREALNNVVSAYDKALLVVYIGGGLGSAIEAARVELGKVAAP